MKNPKEQGKEAWGKFLSVRFEWGSDPKNPFQKGTEEHAAWCSGYAAAEGEWFGK